MKKTTKVILGSVLTMALSASLIAGSTLALFSSQDDVNVAITSGKVDVTATVDDTSIKTYIAEPEDGNYVYKEYTEGAATKAFKLGGGYVYEGGELTLTNIAPGEGISFNLKITNKSTISVKYQVRLTAVNNEYNGTTKDLANVLHADFQFDSATGEFSTEKMAQDAAGGTTISSTSTFASVWSEPITAAKNTETGDAIKTVPVGIWLPTSVSNDYKDAKCTLTIGVYAYQANAHLTDPTEGWIQIYNASELRALSANKAAMTSNIELMNNIYLDERVAGTAAAIRTAYVLADAPLADKGPMTPIGTAENPFTGTFDGKGYTIYGLEVSNEKAGLFGVTENATIRNVTIADATIEATGEGAKAGVLVAEAKGTLNLTNVNVVDSTVKAADGVEGATVGALVGTAEGTVTVDSVDVQMNEGDSAFGNNALVGGEEPSVDYGEKETTIVLTPAEGFVETIVNPGADDAKKWCEISSLNGLTYFAKTVNEGNTFEGATVVLTVDINLASVESWTPIGTSESPFSGTFVGGTVTDGEIVPTVRKISNMTIAKTGTEEGLTEANDKKFAAFFAFTQNAVISNLHFVKANVTNTYAESDGAAGYCAVLVGRTNGGKLEISNVTIGEKPEDTEAGKLAHAQEAPYVTSGKAVAAFVSRSTGDGSITFDNCVNYANLCAPKAAGFIAQFQSSANTPLTIKNSANYGNITMPQSKDILCDKPDVVMGGFIGYIQSSSDVLLVNCVNEGNIDATITQVKNSVGKLNVGGLISSVHSAEGKTTLVDCINRGNIVINQSLTEGAACDGEIGGLIGSTGATMHHVEQLGDITVTNTSDKPMHVGGILGDQDGDALVLKVRSDYVDIPKEEGGAEGNVVDCTIRVTNPNGENMVGAAVGKASVNNSIASTDLDLYIVLNGVSQYEQAEKYLYGLNGNDVTYNVTNTDLWLSATEEGGFGRRTVWDAEGN